jgi:hypothetical protein
MDLGITIGRSARNVDKSVDGIGHAGGDVFREPGRHIAYRPTITVATFVPPDDIVGKGRKGICEAAHDFHRRQGYAAHHPVRGINLRTADVANGIGNPTRRTCVAVSIVSIPVPASIPISAAISIPIPIPISVAISISTASIASQIVPGIFVPVSPVQLGLEIFFLAVKLRLKLFDPRPQFDDIVIHRRTCLISHICSPSMQP